MKRLLSFFAVSILLVGCQSRKDSPTPKAAETGPKIEDKKTPTVLTAEKKDKQATVLEKPVENANQPQSEESVQPQKVAQTTVSAPAPVQSTKTTKTQATQPATPPSAPAAPNAPTTPTANESKEKENVDFVYLDAKDVRDLGQVVASYFQNSASEVLLANPGSLIPIKSATFNGDLNKAQLNVDFEDQSKLEFKDFKIELNKESLVKGDKYNLIAVCVGSECDKIFMTVHIRENSKFAYNWPLVFKKVNGKYLPAFLKANQDYEADNNQFSIDDFPPQYRVGKILELKIEEHKAALLNAVRAEMKKNDAIYTGFFVVGMNRAGIDTEFKATKNNLDYSLKLEFFPDSHRKNIQANGIMADLNESSSYHAESQTMVKLKAIDGNSLLVLMMIQKNYSSLVSGLTTAMYAVACTVLDEKNVTYHECSLISSSEVFGLTAVEGKMEGPIYVSPTEIIPEDDKK